MNYLIDETLRNMQLEERLYQKRRHCLRRINKVRKQDKLLRIINTKGYAPHRGYIDYGFNGPTLLHSGKHIKYPRDSKPQRQLKRATSKKMRHSPALPLKGNSYRRLSEYWWIIY